MLPYTTEANVVKIVNEKLKEQGNQPVDKDTIISIVNDAIENGDINVNTYEKIVSPNEIQSLLEQLASETYTSDTTIKYVCNDYAYPIAQIFERLDAEAVRKLFIENTTEEGYLNKNYNLFADGRPLRGGDNLVELGSFDISIDSDSETGSEVVVVSNKGIDFSTITLIIYGENE